MPSQIFAAFATTDDEHFKVFRLGHFQLLVVRDWRHGDEQLDPLQLVRRNAVFKAKFLEYLSLVGMISAQTLCVCREGKAVSTFPDQAQELGPEKAYRPSEGIMLKPGARGTLGFCGFEAAICRRRFQSCLRYS